MSRPIRIEFTGALYHVTSRGDRREDIYEDDEDRARFLEVLSGVIERDNWVCHAYCLMSNHYHLLIETPDANLSQGMRQLNGVYTQASNRRHGRVGHLFQGRFKAILVDADSYLLELTRYIVLNPVRAGMVNDPAKWAWSSYGAMIGKELSPAWLAVGGLLSQFGKYRKPAMKAYKRFVMEGIGEPSIWEELKNQVYLGDENFITRVQAHKKAQAQDVNIPNAQRRAPAPRLEEIFNEPGHDRNVSIQNAYGTGAYSYQDIADYCGLHFTTIGNIVRGGKKV